MMKEAETWTLCVHAKASRFNFKLKAKRFFFPNFYQLSFKLKTHPRLSSLKKSKTLKSKFFKILEKCRFKHVNNTATGANTNSTSRCISSAGPNSGNLAKFNKWIATGEKYMRGIAIQKQSNIIYWFLMIFCALLVCYWVIEAKHNNFICNAAVGFLYRMFGELLG